MSRIRTIKPEFFQSPTVAELPFRARLTFIGIWTYVDDEGRCRLEPRVIAGQLWPLDDDVNGPEVENDLDIARLVGLVTVYEVDGKRYLAVNGWREHQRINRPTTSKLPPPPVDESSRKEELSPGFSTELSLGEDSLSTHPRKGRERNVEMELGNGRGEIALTDHGELTDVPWCAKHAGGTSEPCRDCADARHRYEVNARAL